MIYALQRMRLALSPWARLTRQRGAALLIVAIAVGKPFPATGSFLSSRSRCFSFRSSSFRAMLAASKINGDDSEIDPFPNLKVLDPKNLRRYYEETKRIILLHGSRNQNGGDARSTRMGDAQSSLSSVSLEEKPVKTRGSCTEPRTKAFSLQHFEPRHRKSMMRCVLNHFHSVGSKEDKGKGETKTKPKKIVSKADFQQRLRSVDQKKRWRMTRLLLFGENSVHGSSNNERQHWWESGVLQEEKAPGLEQGIREYRDSWDSKTPGTKGKRMVDEDKDDPKRFLSRLAKGRTYKGDFRILLHDYVATTNKSDNEQLIALYDKIAGFDESRSTSCKETNQRDVELLHLFIDELEEDSRAAAGTAYSNDQGDSSGEIPSPNAEPSALVVSGEQISLLRTICDLDIFCSPPPPKSAFPSSGSPSLDDDGRSAGKKGERDLETFLVKKHMTEGTNSLEISSDTRVLSPVWVRPKVKNRRNIKQKCRYVLEIPRFKDTENNNRSNNSNNTKIKSNSFFSKGTTNEFDAMVVRVINGCNNDESKDPTLPIMVIKEVWDAKATLDPSALMDVLDKKTGSLHKILCDENTKVVNISEISSAAGDCGSATLMANQGNEKKTIGDGANFVVLPLPENKKKISTDARTTGSNSANDSSPMVYRVGIEPSQNKNNDGECGEGIVSYQSMPQIGVFANRMISPRAAARRIQTIIYEGLLETDLSTVKGVIRRHQGDCDWHSDEMNNHCNALVRDRSVEIVERMLRLIDTLQPLAVTET